MIALLRPRRTLRWQQESVSTSKICSNLVCYPTKNIALNSERKGRVDMSNRILGTALTFVMTGFIVFLNRDGTVPPEVTAITGMVVGFISGTMLRYATGPRASLQFQSGSGDHRVHVAHYDTLQAIEPKIFFDLLSIQANGSRSLIRSESISLSHLPMRSKKAKAATIIVSVPDAIIARFTQPEMELIVSLTVAHRYTGFRSLICEAVPFSALFPVEVETEKRPTV